MENFVTWAMLGWALYHFLFLKTEKEQDRANAIFMMFSPIILAIAAFITYGF